MDIPVTFHRERPTQQFDRHADGPENPGRRTLLAAMAGAAAMAATGCKGPPAEPIFSYASMPEGAAPGEAVFYATSVRHGGGAFGVLVETHDGRPTKVEGNSDHQASLGATDARTQATVLQLWDPDRSRNVLRDGMIAGPDGLRRALRERLPALQARSGRGLHILTGPCASPTMMRQLRELAEALPRMAWHVHDALPDDAAAAAWFRLTGTRARVRYRLDRARLLVCLDADPLRGAAGVRHAQDIVRARAGGCTVHVLQSSPSLIASHADRCRTLAPWQIECVLEALAASAGVPDTGAMPAEASTAAMAAELGRMLAQHRGSALIIGGPTLSPRAHEIIWALNQRAGSLGTCLEVAQHRDAPVPQPLSSLVASMSAGEVDTLLVLDANPAYDAPASGFAQGMARVPLCVHLGLYRDETARLAGWHAPRPHDFEAWSDAHAWDGSAGIVQPVIAPLHDSVSPHTVLSWLAGADLSAHQAVQSTWRTAWAADFDARWREALRRGVIDAPDAASIAAGPALAPRSRPPPRPPGLVLRLLPSHVAGDFGNNAWLHELPDPHTRVVWDNAVLLSAATAAALGVRTGDVLELRAGETIVQAPALVGPGQADGVLAVAAGYGRTAAGSVGNRVGANAHGLVPPGMHTGPVRARALGRRHAFSRVQTETSTHGREVILSVEPGHGVPRHEPLPSLYPPVPYPDHAWAMNIDLDACTGCGVCTIACQAENNIPVVGREEVARGRVMHWIRVDRYDDVGETGAFQPVPCMHCENAPCEEVCPVGATVHDSDGLNAQVYNRCIGTRFCSNNCPYKVRRFNFFEYSAGDAAVPAQRNPGVTVRSRGVMEKCTYCVQRINRARIHAGRTGAPLRDGDVVTACQAACPSRAIVFGDLNDPASAVNRARASPRHYALLEALNTRPRTTYLARVRRKADGGDASQEGGDGDA
ncbi:Tetrathionate reductase subunit B precursor [Pigmentiphaga humi]|uniref:Tetrathionate reductase subunit B n=1 Tax=Pigmentiphaga humi TaxID=2478468 RepID=A0A3P4AXJ2_9BURK|nr:4Fe-4S dicluster domain-containing protein [Pigmentiphaga humi]VCU68789.1 Tetrathionate reductase subunit B precursor [Pigmentiphaga humi]